MHDARRGRDDAEIAERFLAPFEELVAFHVALEFLLPVLEQRHLAAEFVDLHAVVDDQIDGDERVDFERVAAHAFHRRPHRRQVHHARHARKIPARSPGPV